MTFTTTQAEYSGYKPMFDHIATSLQVIRCFIEFRHRNGRPDDVLRP